MKRATKYGIIVLFTLLLFFPLVFCNGKLEPTKGISMRQDMPETVVFDFTKEGVRKGFLPITDNVMGGVSTAQFEAEKSPEEFAAFTGNLSLDNFGGFATVRSPTKTYDLSEFSGLELRLRGDGKTYIFFLKSNEKNNGYQYQTWFATQAGKWEDIKLPFSEFRPYYRGMKLRLWAGLNPGKIQAMGFMIADKQDGSFNLDVQYIGAYKNSDP